MIPEIQPGSPLSSAHQNRLIAQVNRNARPAGPGVIHAGETGALIGLPSSALLRRFELTATLTYPANAKQAPYTDDAEVVYYSNYDTQDVSRAVAGNRLYYPGALRDSNKNYIGLPKLRVGMEVTAWWNRQSGRWEMIQVEPQSGWDGVLDAELTQGNSATVSVYINGGDSGVNVTATDNYLSVGESLPIATKVEISWRADDGRFIVTGAEC